MASVSTNPVYESYSYYAAAASDLPLWVPEEDIRILLASSRGHLTASPTTNTQHQHDPQPTVESNHLCNASSASTLHAAAGFVPWLFRTVDTKPQPY